MNQRDKALAVMGDLHRELTTPARQTARLGSHLYYVARSWEDEYRIRIYTIVAGQICGLDQLLNEAELRLLELPRTPISPGGLRLQQDHPRYVTSYAAAKAVGQLLGFDCDPVAL